MIARVPADPYAFPRRGGLVIAETALVVIDMQHDFCSPGGYWEAIGGDPADLRAPVPFIRRALLAARHAGLAVVHTRAGRRPEAPDARPGAAGGKRLLQRHLVRGEPGWQIVDELAPVRGETVIDKPATGAFHGTDLDPVLRGRGIGNLAICGVTTAICVSTTVREAADRGYGVLVLGDACAEGDPAVHEAALASFRLEDGLFGTVATTDAFVGTLGALS